MFFKKIILSVLLLCVSFILCGCEKKVNQKPMQEKEENKVVELYHRESVDNWLKENYIFFNIAFMNCADGGKQSNITYQNIPNKMRVLSSYLSTFGKDAIIELEPFHQKVRMNDLSLFSQKLFDEKIEVEELEMNGFLVEDDFVSISLPTGFGVSLPVFWKFEQESNELYSMYILDYACSNIEGNETFISPGTTFKEEDRIKYKPGLIKIQFRHSEDENYLVSSSFTIDVD